MQEIPLTTEGSVWLAVASLSDVGCVRANNEDSVGVFPGEHPKQGNLLVVADGMGGAAAGEVASKIAVDAVGEEFFRNEGEAPVVALKRALESANAAIHAKACADPQYGGMGTTCTAVVVVGNELWYGHVGDSRAYIADGTRLYQITRDHSLAAEFERVGEGGAPARARNVLTRCLGVRPEVEVDVSERATPMDEGTVVLLCSDGLCNLVDDGEIHQVVSMHRPDGACRRLVQLAKERGAPDNVSLAVGRITRH